MKRDHRLSSQTLSKPTHQRGLSLIELLVGMAIGLLVALAATSSLMFTRLVQQTITGQVARTSATTDLRNFFNSSRNPVLYSTNSTTSARGWYIDLPAAGERLLSNPSVSSGRLVRFDTRIPADSVAEGTCSTTPPPELGFLNVINGVTGMPANQPVFYSADATLDLRNASRVQYGAGETVSVDTGRRTSIYDLGSVGGPASNRTSPVQINRFSYIPRRIDWRILP